MTSPNSELPDAPRFDGLTRLFDGIERFGDRVALIQEDGSAFSYSELLELGAQALTPLGGARRLVVIELATAVEPIAVYVAALRAGHVVVISGEGGGDAGSAISKAFQPEFVYSRSEDGWTWKSHPARPHALHNELAVLLSTSGSTGSPKLVRLSHGALIANSQAIIEYLNYQPGERAFVALPLYFSYGMSILNSQLLSGGTLVLNTLSVTDSEFWKKFDGHQATSLTGVPHTYELLEQSQFLETEHPSLRYMACGGGRLSPEKVKVFARYASARGQRFYVTYGQTEGGPRMAYLPPEDAPTYPDCIGRPIPGGTLRLDGVSAEGVGELVFSGPSIMLGYAFSSADLGRGREIVELRTGDLAKVNEAGYFRIEGRASRFSKIFGVRIALDDVERMLAEAGHEGAVSGDDTGIVVVIPGNASINAVRDMLATRLRIPANCIFVADVDAIPRQLSGKVDYPAILSLRPAMSVESPSSLRREMARILGMGSVGPEDTFIGMGGDSLSYVRAAMLLERILGHTPKNWENTPFGVLERARHKKLSVPTLSLESGIVVRALAIVIIVANHATQFGAGGLATTLLIVAGANFARFQVPRLISGRSIELLKSTFVKLVLPYLAVITAYTVVIQEIFWPQFLLFSNFTSGFFLDGERRFSVYWFIETYIGLTVFAALLFLIPAFRTAARNRPIVFALTGFGCALALAIVARQFFYLPAFYSHTPLALAYVFLYGWLVDIAKTNSARIAVAAVGIGLFSLLPADAGISSLLVIVAAVLCVLFVRQVPVGRALGRVISVLAAASFHIYIAHGFVIHALERFGVPFGHDTSLLDASFVVLAGVGLGVVVWWTSEYVASRAWPTLAATTGRTPNVGQAAVASSDLLPTDAAAAPDFRVIAPTMPATLKPRILVHEPAFRRIQPNLVDEVDVVLMSSDGSLSHDGFDISALEAQPEAAWISQDIFGTPQARNYWAALLASRRLAWTHSDAAGTDGPIYGSLMATGTKLTTNDTQAVAIAEYVLGEALCHFQRIAERRSAQSAGEWQALPFREIAGSHWLVIGFGAIGQAVATRVKAFGAHVTGVRRSHQAHAAADHIIALNQIREVLPTTDVIVLSVPLTAETHGLVNEDFLSHLRKGSVLVNVGRGGLVNENALVAALASDAPEKAILDVFEVEPLPVTSPLWKHDKVVVSAHAAAMGAGRTTRSDMLFLENLSRYVRLQRLRNVVPASSRAVENPNGQG